VPWCDECSKFWNLPELGGEAKCPACGRGFVTSTARPSVAPALPGGPTSPAEEPSPTDPSATVPAKAKGAPWHFKLLVVGVTVYMIYRIYWLIEWLPKHV